MSLNPNLSQVHSLSTNVLVENGWVRTGSVYTKWKNSVKFDGVHWILNEKKRVQFLEDLPIDDNEENRDYYDQMMNIP